MHLDVTYCGRIAVVKLGAMVLNVVLYYARGETNSIAATNIVEFQQQQEYGWGSQQVTATTEIVSNSPEKTSIMSLV